MTSTSESDKRTHQKLNDSAKEHLWLHFTRHSAHLDPEAQLPIIVKGEGPYTYIPLLAKKLLMVLLVYLQLRLAMAVKSLLMLHQNRCKNWISFSFGHMATRVLSN